MHVEAHAENIFAPNITPSMSISTLLEIQKIDALLPKYKKITYQVNGSFHYAYKQTGPCTIITINLRNQKQLSHTYQVGCEY